MSKKTPTRSRLELTSRIFICPWSGTSWKFPLSEMNATIRAVMVRLVNNKKNVVFRLWRFSYIHFLDWKARNGRNARC